MTPCDYRTRIRLVDINSIDNILKSLSQKQITTFKQHKIEIMYDRTSCHLYGINYRKPEQKFVSVAALFEMGILK
jgi:hypothetical protein